MGSQPTFNVEYYTVVWRDNMYNGNGLPDPLLTRSSKAAVPLNIVGLHFGSARLFQAKRHSATLGSINKTEPGHAGGFRRTRTFLNPAANRILPIERLLQSNRYLDAIQQLPKLLMRV